MWVRRAGNGLPPAMTRQQPVDGAWMNRMAQVGFQRVANLGGRRDVALDRTCEEGRKKRLFLARREVFIAAAAFARGVEGRWSDAVVGRDDQADRGN